MSLKIKYGDTAEPAYYNHKDFDPPALALDERGMILDCSKSFEAKFGLLRSELVWQHISCLFPQFEGVELVELGELNPMFSYLCRCGHSFHMQNRQGDISRMCLSLVCIENNGRKRLRLIVRSLAGLERDQSAGIRRGW